MSSDPTLNDPYFCSFCGATRHHSRALIVGPAVAICSPCLGTCLETLSTQLNVPLGELPAALLAERNLRQVTTDAIVKIGPGDGSAGP